MQGGVNEDGFFTDIDVVFREHAHHSGDAFFDGTFAALDFDHRGIQPDADAFRGMNAIAAVGAFTDDGSSGYVTGFQRVHESFAVDVDQHSAEGADLFGDESAEDLFRESSAGRMVLEGIRVEQFCTSSVAQNQTVSGSAVVVGGGEALVVHSASAAGSDDDGLCTGDQDFIGFHVHQDSACCMALVVLNQLDSSGKVDDRDTAVEDLITEGSHDFSAGVVLSSVHSLSGGTAAVGGDHGAVGFLIELNAQVIQPLDCFRSLGNQLIDQFLFCCEMSAAESVEEVLSRGVTGFISSLDTALSHHGVGVAHSQLGDDHGFCTVVVCLDCSGSTGSAAADDQDIDIVVRVGEVDLIGVDAGVRLEDSSQFQRDLVALIGADGKVGELAFLVVRVIGFEEDILLFSGHTSGIKSNVNSSCSLDLFHRFKHFLGIHL